jgi:hypothetical protein
MEKKSREGKIVADVRNIIVAKADALRFNCLGCCRHHRIGQSMSSRIQNVRNKEEPE